MTFQFLFPASPATSLEYSLGLENEFGALCCVVTFPPEVPILFSAQHFQPSPKTLRL